MVFSRRSSDRSSLAREKEAAETTLRTKSLFVKYFFCAKFRRAISHIYTHSKQHTNSPCTIHISFDARTSLIKFFYFFSDFDSLSHYYTSMATDADAAVLLFFFSSASHAEFI